MYDGEGVLQQVRSWRAEVIRRTDIGETEREDLLATTDDWAARARALTRTLEACAQAMDPVVAERAGGVRRKLRALHLEVAETTRALLRLDVAC